MFEECTNGGMGEMGGVVVGVGGCGHSKQGHSRMPRPPVNWCTNRRSKAEPQQIVAQRLLSCSQYLVPIKSSTEDLT